MLNESAVVDYVCRYLIARGYSIEQRLKTSEIGIDIVARNQAGKRCFVEAKGATSSRKTSSRHGKEFDRSQVKTHIGVAIIAAFKALERYSDSESYIAVPNNRNHRELLQAMVRPLNASGIKVLLVSEDGSVVDGI